MDLVMDGKLPLMDYEMIYAVGDKIEKLAKKC